MPNVTAMPKKGHIINSGIIETMFTNILEIFYYLHKHNYNNRQRKAQ